MTAFAKQSSSFPFLFSPKLTFVISFDPGGPIVTFTRPSYSTGASFPRGPVFSWVISEENRFPSFCSHFSCFRAPFTQFIESSVKEVSGKYLTKAFLFWKKNVKEKKYILKVLSFFEKISGYHGTIHSLSRKIRWNSFLMTCANGPQAFVIFPTLGSCAEKLIGPDWITEPNLKSKVRRMLT